MNFIEVQVRSKHCKQTSNLSNRVEDVWTFFKINLLFDLIWGKVLFWKQWNLEKEFQYIFTQIIRIFQKRVQYVSKWTSSLFRTKHSVLALCATYWILWCNLQWRIYSRKFWNLPPPSLLMKKFFFSTTILKTTVVELKSNISTFCKMMKHFLITAGKVIHQNVFVVRFAM